jgi:anti-sigma B factor antagonist
VVAPIGDLDAATNPAFLDALKDAARAGGKLVVDLSGVAFMSAGALGSIARTAAFLGSREGELVVVCPNERVRRLFEIAGFDEKLEIVTCMPEAA